MPSTGSAGAAAEMEGNSGTPPDPSEPQLQEGREGVEQGAFHPQNRNCGEEECAKEECLGGWEVSGKRSSSEKWHLRRV